MNTAISNLAREALARTPSAEDAADQSVVGVLSVTRQSLGGP